MRRLLISASALVLIATAANAGADRDDDAYRETFLAACEEGATRTACRCVMQRVEDRVSTVAFAEEIDRHGLRIMTADSLAPVIASAQRYCEATAMK